MESEIIEIARENRRRILYLAGCKEPIVKRVSYKEILESEEEISSCDRIAEIKDGIKLEEVIIPVHYTRKGPFTIAYVYSRDGAAFIIRDKWMAIYEYFKTYPYPAIVHTKVYHKIGAKVKHSVIGCCNLYKISIVKNIKTHRYNLKVYYSNFSELFFEKEFRRMPRGWIRELDPFVV